MIGSSVSKFRMTAGHAEKIIRELAADTSNIIWCTHAEERKEQRGITTLDALVVLRGGFVEESPTTGKHSGEWCCKVVKKLRGNREAGVITVIMTRQKKLKIITVEWEDLP